MDRFVETSRWLESRVKSAAQHPFLRPIIGPDLSKRIFQEILRKRAVPLLKRVVGAQLELRTERADRARERSGALLSRIRRFEAADVESPDAFFAEVNSISTEIDAILDDANYAVFEQVELLHQLRALNLALKSSHALWHVVRMGFALKDPVLAGRAIGLGIEAQEAFDKGWRGENIARDLVRLEDRCGAFKDELDLAMARDSGLAPGLDALRVSGRVWSYRMLLEQAVVERRGLTEGHLSNRELCEDVRANGIPPEVIETIYRNDIVPVLRSIRDDPDRNEHAERLRERAGALIERLEGPEVRSLKTADEVEKFTIEVGRELDEILGEAEQVTQPVDGLFRRLRDSRSAADAVRVLLLGLRINETAYDDGFLGRASALLREVRSLIDHPHDVERRLAELEQHVVALSEELKARLQLKDLPTLETSLSVLRGTRKAIRLGSAAKMALNPDVRLAAEAFSNLEMKADKRRAIYDRALGKPLLETVVGLLLATREIDLGFSFADCARTLQRFLHVGGKDGDVNPAIARSPLAFLARADFETAFTRLDQFFENVDTPERLASIDASLNVVRAIATVERQALGHLAAHIPEGEGLHVAGATAEWVLGSIQVLMEWGARQLAEPSGTASSEFLHLMVDATEAHLDALIARDPRELVETDLVGLKTGLRTSARSGLKQVGLRRAPDAAHALTDRLPQGDYAERLHAINARLMEQLGSVETTPASRAAINHILGDLGSTLRTVVNLIHLFGAASNDLMDADDRQAAIQGSIERMGPLFVKLMQTLGNIQGLLAKLSPDFEMAENDPLLVSLRKLQDEVTPLPWPYIEREIRRSLEIADDVPLVDGEGHTGAFVSLDQEPLKSGSIGQVHRARIRVDRGGGEEIVSVVVKVLRPGIDNMFEDTIRVTRLTTLLFKEMLRLDVNAAIFGEVKPEAERILAMLDRALEGFIGSFRIETDFVQEGANMRRFSAMLATERSVVVPEVFASHSKGSIITMEEIKGFKLSKWIARYRAAEEAPALAEDLGPLPEIGASEEAVRRAASFIEQTYGTTASEARFERRTISGRDRVRVRFQDPAGRLVDRVLEVRADGRIRCKDGLPAFSRALAERKAVLWSQRAFGLPVRSVSAEAAELPRGPFSRRAGFLVRLEFDAEHPEHATVFVDKNDGSVEPRSPVPDLSLHGLEALRDRLTTAFGIQLARGFLHGDPHEGNFFVLPDGETIGLIDFGLAIEVGLLDAIGPLMLLSGALLGRPRAMADAMLRMSTQADLQNGPERDAIIARLTEEYTQIIGEVWATGPKERPNAVARFKQSALTRFEQAIEVSKRALEQILRGAGLAPSPRYLQALKASVSMGGNLAKIEKLGIKTPKWKRALRLFKEIAIHTALRPFVQTRRPQRAQIQLPRDVELVRRDQSLERLEHVKQSRAPDAD